MLPHNAPNPIKIVQNMSAILVGLNLLFILFSFGASNSNLMFKKVNRVCIKSTNSHILCLTYLLISS